MSHDTISFEEIKFPIRIENEMAWSYGEGSHKTLQMIIRIENQPYEKSLIEYKVLENNKLAGIYPDLTQAINLYNSLP